MAYLNISDFRSGLDARKYKLSLPAGTLTSLSNAHITAGGEIEKRKAFLPLDLSALDLAGTFGAESTLKGIVVFGSRQISWPVTSLARNTGNVDGVSAIGPDGYVLKAGDSVTINDATDPTFNGTFTLTYGGTPNVPIFGYVQAGSNASTSGGTITLNIAAPVIYQRLLHPDGVTQMTSVIYSTVFGPNTFVIAEFADGNSFYYYAGTLINDFQAGLIWSGSTNGFSLLTQLAAIINGTTLVNGLPVTNYPFVASVTPLPAALSLTVSGGTAAVLPVYATGTLAISGNPSSSSTVTLGSVTYTFVNSATNPNEVTRGNATVSIQNLYNAILATGTGFGAGTVANPDAAVSSLIAGKSFLATAKTIGTPGNAVGTTASTVPDSNCTWSNTTLLGGVGAAAGYGQINTLFFYLAQTVQLTPYLGTNAANILQSPIAFAGQAQGVLTLPANPNDGDQVVVGSKTYTFRTAINNATPNEILIDATDVNQTLWSLADAVVLYGPSAGTYYSSATTINVDATAADSALPTNGQLAFTAIAYGASAVATSTTVTGGSWSCGAHLLYVNSDALMAIAIAAAVNNATDAYFGGPGTNLGFVAVANGTSVSITPPAAMLPASVLYVTTDNYLTITAPPINVEMTITSVPNTQGSAPFAITDLLNSVGGSEITTLLNVGAAVVPATFAVGSFQVTACNASTQATAVLSSDGNNVGAGNTVTIGSTVYTFVTTLAAAAVNAVLIGSNAQASMKNLIAAMLGLTTAGGGSGKTWAAGTAPNPDMTPGSLVSAGGGVYYVVLTSILGGVIGNHATGWLSLSAASLSWLVSPGGAATTHPVNGADSNQVTQIAVGATNILSAEVPSSSNSPVTMANDIVTAINNNSANSGFSASAVNGIVSIAAVAGGAADNGLNIVITCAGAVCVDQCEFIVSGTGGISYIAVAGGPANLLSVTTLAFQDGGHPTETLIQFCSRVVANINAYTGTTGYVAASDPQTSVIFISRAASSSGDASPVVVTVTSTLTITPSTVTMQATPTSTLAVIPYGGSKPSNAISIIVIGGTAPYSYQWSCISGNAGTLLNAASLKKQTTTWPHTFPFTGSYPQTWICTVTDSSTPTPLTAVTVPVTVQQATA